MDNMEFVESNDTLAEVAFVSAADVISFLQTQHDVIKALFETIPQLMGEERKNTFYQLRRLLAVHETAEEQIVHPMARQLDTVGDGIVEERLREENAAKKILARLESMDLDSDEFETAFEELQDAVLLHAEAEEEEEFEALDEELDEEKLVQMRRIVQLAEAVAPTRPHPGVESALANTLVGPFASMLDRVRDLVTGKRGT
jgi:hemerythrin superfamily protein